jgi:hypothetical protein
VSKRRFSPPEIPCRASRSPGWSGRGAIWTIFSPTSPTSCAGAPTISSSSPADGSFARGHVSQGRSAWWARARHARDGFGVQAVLDASGSPNDLSEEFSRQRMHDAGVVLTATNTLIAEIAQDWSTPTGQQLITLLFTDVFPALGTGIA